MWDLTLEELLEQGFVNKKIYNICLKLGLSSLYWINEFSKVKSFTSIKSCGYATCMILRSLCEKYNQSVNLLQESPDISNFITFETTIEELFESDRIILLSYKTCIGAGCETIEDISNKLDSHRILKQSRPGVKKELRLLCEEAEANRMITSLRYNSSDNFCQIPDVILHSHEDYQITNETTIETLLELGKLSKRAYNCCRSVRVFTFEGIINNQDRFNECPNWGIKTIEELRKLCEGYKS